MRRNIRILIATLVFAVRAVFSACSEMTMNQDASFQDSLFYSYRTFTLSTAGSVDITTPLRDDAEVFLLALELSVENGSIEAIPFGVEELVAKMKDVCDGTGTSMRVLLSGTTQELNDAATAAGLTLSVTEVIAFNDLKTVLETVGTSIRIAKSRRVAQSLGRPLTSDEIIVLDDLQNAFNAISHQFYDVDPASITEAEFIDYLDQLTPLLTETDRQSVMAGFALWSGLRS